MASVQVRVSLGTSRQTTVPILNLMPVRSSDYDHTGNSSGPLSRVELLIASKLLLYNREVKRQSKQKKWRVRRHHQSNESNRTRDCLHPRVHASTSLWLSLICDDDRVRKDSARPSFLWFDGAAGRLFLLPLWLLWRDFLRFGWSVCLFVQAKARAIIMTQLYVGPYIERIDTGRLLLCCFHFILNIIETSLV